MKKMFLCLVLIFTCCMFFGCDQSLPHSDSFILLTVSSNRTGQVEQTLQFSVGSEALKATGATDAEMIKFIQVLTANIQNFRDEFYINYMLVYNANPMPDYQLGKGLIVTKATYQERSDSIGFSLRFTSQEAWRYYHPSSEEGTNNNQVEHGYINRVISQGQFPFAGEVKLHDGTTKLVAERYIEAYLAATVVLSNKTAVQQNYQPDLVYDYATPFQQIKSDADYHFLDADNVSHHTWLVQQQELNQNNSITLFTTEVNRGLWYVTFLGVVLAGCGIAIGIILWRQRKRSPKKS